MPLLSTSKKKKVLILCSIIGAVIYSLAALWYAFVNLLYHMGADCCEHWTFSVIFPMIPLTNGFAHTNLATPVFFGGNIIIGLLLGYALGSWLYKRKNKT